MKDVAFFCEARPILQTQISPPRAKRVRKRLVTNPETLVGSTTGTLSRKHRMRELLNRLQLSDLHMVGPPRRYKRPRERSKITSTSLDDRK